MLADSNIPDELSFEFDINSNANNAAECYVYATVAEQKYMWNVRTWVLSRSYFLLIAPRQHEHGKKRKNNQDLSSR